MKIKNRRLMLAALIQIVLLLAVGFGIPRFTRVEKEILDTPIESWVPSGMRWEDGCWRVNEGDLPSTAETRSGVIALRVPFPYVEDGEYRMAVEYACDSEQGFGPYDAIDGEAYYDRRVLSLPAGKNLAVYDFSAMGCIDDMNVAVYYDGTGSLEIRGVTLTPKPASPAGTLVALSFFLFLFDWAWLKRKWLYENRKFVYGLFLIVIGASIPLFVQGLYLGHDMDFHLNRIEGIAEELRRGVFPVRMGSFWKGGYGFPVSVCYGDWLLYLPALLRCLGFKVLWSYKFYILLINAGTAAISYACMNGIVRDKRAALLGSAVYTTSAYRLLNLYIRSAAGEYTAMMFMPIVALAACRIDREEKTWGENALLLAAGMTGIVTSHVLSTEMTAFALALFCLIRVKHTLRPRALLTYVAAVVGTLLLSVSFLVPFLDYMLTQNMRINSAINDLHWIQASGAYVGQLLASFIRPFGQSAELVRERLGLTPGFTIIVSVFMAGYFAVCGHGGRQFHFLLGATVFFLFASTDMFPWDKLFSYVPGFLYLCQIQFIWRFLSFGVLFGGLLVAEMMRIELSVDKRTMTLLLSILCALGCCVFSSFYFTGSRYVFFEERYELNSNTSSGEEYLLVGTKTKEMPPDPQNVSADFVRIIDKDGSQMLLYCAAGAEDASFELPLLNYKAYEAEAVGSPSTPILVDTGENNRVRLHVPAGFEGRIRVRYVAPAYWHIAEAVSLLSAAAMALLWARLVRKRRAARTAP